MGRSPRFIPAGATVEITCRTVGGRFLLRPGEAMNQAILAVLGRALQLLPIDLHAFAFLSNHWHGLVTTPDAQALAMFMGYVHGNIARAAQMLHSWDGPVWKRGAETIVVTDDDAAVGRLRYIIAQGTKEGLVSSPLEWPGVSSTRALATGEPLVGSWCDRRRAAQIRRSGREPTPAEIHTRYPIPLAPLPAWSRYSASRRRALVIELVRSVEDDARGVGVSPLGATAICARDPHAAPAAFVPRRPPCVHASTVAARSDFMTLRRAFFAAFYAASDTVRSTSPERFPLGAFPPAAAFVPWREGDRPFVRRRRGEPASARHGPGTASGAAS